MSHLPTIWEAVKTALVGLVDHPPDATTFPTGWPGVPLKGVADNAKNQRNAFAAVKATMNQGWRRSLTWKPIP